MSVLPKGKKKQITAGSTAIKLFETLRHPMLFFSGMSLSNGKL